MSRFGRFVPQSTIERRMREKDARVARSLPSPSTGVPMFKSHLSAMTQARQEQKAATRATMPKSTTVRPLGTPRTKAAKTRATSANDELRWHDQDRVEKEVHLDTQKTVDTSTASVVSSDHESPTVSSALMDAGRVPTSSGDPTMTLTFKGLSTTGKTAIYSGLRTNVRFTATNFDGAPPATLEINGAFAGPRVAETKDARKARLAAQPKPTQAEKIAAVRRKLAKLEAAASF